ncbi:MAG: hypothetical protein WA863_07280 [Methyloceanibacter sp.]
MPDPSVTALRGTIVRYTGDPFLAGPASTVLHEPDGLIVCRDGLIEAVGAYDRVRSNLPSVFPSPTIPAASSRRPSSTRMCTMRRAR